MLIFAYSVIFGDSSVLLFDGLVLLLLIITTFCAQHDKKTATDYLVSDCSVFCSINWNLSLVIACSANTDSCPMIGSFHFILYLIIRHWITETCSFFNHFFNFLWNSFSINPNTNILKLIGISIFTIKNYAIILFSQNIKQVIRLRLKSRNSIDCRERLLTSLGRSVSAPTYSIDGACRGERCERRRGRIKRAERVAAVGEGRRRSRRGYSPGTATGDH